MDSMPKIRTAFTRGLTATWSSPVVVIALLSWLLVEWVLIVALGFPGPASVLAHLSAPPLLSTETDLRITIGLFGYGGLIVIFVVAAVHALWMSIVTGFAIEGIESGQVSRWGAIRGLRAFPVVFALRVVGLLVWYAAQILIGVGGLGIALLVYVGILVAFVWLTAFAPVIAVAEGRGWRDAFGRSYRAARLPGSGNLSFAAIYVLPVFTTLVSPSVPGSLLDVNPPFTAWAFIVLLNLLHIAVLAAFAMRYLAIADEVPDAPSRATPARGSRAGERSSAKSRSRGR
jgi:hypothetical protein